MELVTSEQQKVQKQYCQYSTYSARGLVHDFFWTQFSVWLPKPTTDRTDVQKKTLLLP